MDFYKIFLGVDQFSIKIFIIEKNEKYFMKKIENMSFTKENVCFPFILNFLSFYWL